MKKLLLFLSATFFLTEMAFSQCGNSTQYGYVGFYDDGSADGNYLDNQSCSWQFTSATNAPIRLGFYEFDTEANYDYVRIYDGPDAGYPMVAELSGNIAPGVIVCTSTVVYVTFTTDDSYVYSGFYGWWDVNTTMTSCSSYVSSGNYNPYPDNVHQGVLIMPSNADQVTFSFASMDIESCCDYVQVFDGTSENGFLLGTFTGNQIPSTLTATSGAMYILFHTDGSIGGTGWSGYYQCSTCAATQSQSDCFGSILDGSDVDVYSDYSSCSWLVNVPGAVHLTFDFTYMDTESCCDFVRIYDGPNASSALLSEASGSLTPTGIVTSTGTAFIQFSTDGSINGQGWAINYQCSTVGVEESGTISMGTMQVYPNPARDFLNVVLSESFQNTVELTLYNTLGTAVSKKQINVSGSNRLAKLELENLASGNYLLLASDGVQKTQQRIVVN